MTSYTTFFGDAERTFTLTPALLVELETLTNAGAIGVVRRFPGGEARAHEVQAILRLGLIGGGEAPSRAAKLVDLYTAGHAYAEAYEIAQAVILAAVFGAPDEEATDAA